MLMAFDFDFVDSTIIIAVDVSTRIATFFVLMQFRFSLSRSEATGDRILREVRPLNTRPTRLTTWLRKNRFRWALNANTFLESDNTKNLLLISLSLMSMKAVLMTKMIFVAVVAVADSVTKNVAVGEEGKFSRWKHL